VLTAAALVPSPPIVVPELNGADASESEPLRAAALAAIATLGSLASRWTVIGVGDTERELDSNAVGTFRGFGADVRAALSADACQTPDPMLPLAVLVAGWLREQAAPHAVATARIVAADTSPVYCTELGRTLRAELDRDDTAHGLLVLADGANTLTAKAPGAFDPRAGEAQTELDDAIAAGEPAVLAGLDPVVCGELGIAGRAAYQVLAGVFESSPARVESRYRDAPFGVGYHVAVWFP
jgi:hypothetical protein